jgi:phospholipid N-methyltransferase
MLVIQRKIMKAQAMVHQSVARVIDVSRSRVSLKNVKRGHSLSPNESEDAMIRKPSPFAKSPLVLFAKEILQNPRAVGAACPSSPQLAKAVAKFVPLIAGQGQGQGLIVDLGAGTGVMTKALIKRGIAPERIVAVELSSHLATYLRQHFPQVRVIEGDATHLRDLLGADCPPVSTVICGLPFRLLPPRVVHGIVTEAEKVLQKNGLYMQYTYDLMTERDPFLPHHFRRISSKLVWSNIPPARVNVYRVEH